MENWKVIAALILFFPLGLYLMFKYTDWTGKIKWIISAFYAFFAGIFIVSEMFYELVFLLAFALSIASIIWFVNAIIRRKNKRNALIALVLGLFLTVYSVSTISAQTAEAERIEQEEKLEQERIVEEERQEQERLAEEKRLQEIEENQLSIATEAVETAENSPTRSNYDNATNLASDLSSPNEDLEIRLDDIEILVKEYEEALEETTIALEDAEEVKDRDTYDNAYLLVSSLPVESQKLITRLEDLDEELTIAEEKEAEEERLAKEKAEKEEAGRKAAEEKAAQEKAETEKRAAEEKITEEAESSGGNSGSSNNGGSSQTTPPSNESSPKLYVDQNGEGTIKGSNTGIYHVPGSTYYSRTKNVAQWFKTVEEAEAAGYRDPER